MPTPLCQLARKHGSDKFSAKHSYTAWYFSEFASRRESIRKVVEIGVGEGASLRMWREFFPNAEVIGADNDPARAVGGVILCDQSKPNDLAALLQRTGPDVDLFIDDGSHRPEHQRFTMEYMMPLLAPGVTYVIEDVAEFWHTPHTEPYVIEMPELEHRRRYDNRLIVVRHAAN